MSVQDVHLELKTLHRKTMNDTTRLTGQEAASRKDSLPEVTRTMKLAGYTHDIDLPSVAGLMVLQGRPEAYMVRTATRFMVRGSVPQTLSQPWMNEVHGHTAVLLCQLG